MLYGPVAALKVEIGTVSGCDHDVSRLMFAISASVGWETISAQARTISNPLNEASKPVPSGAAAITPTVSAGTSVR